MPLKVMKTPAGELRSPRQVGNLSLLRVGSSESRIISLWIGRSAMQASLQRSLHRMLGLILPGREMLRIEVLEHSAEVSSPLPARRGQRPRTPLALPHIQLDQWPPEDVSGT